jgi:hypothetical protein
MPMKKSSEKTPLANSKTASGTADLELNGDTIRLIEDVVM